MSKELPDYSDPVVWAKHRRSWCWTLFGWLILQMIYFAMVALVIGGYWSPWSLIAAVFGLIFSAYNWSNSIPNYLRHRDGLDTENVWIGLVSWPLLPGSLTRADATITFDEHGKVRHMRFDIEGEQVIIEFEADTDDET